MGKVVIFFAKKISGELRFQLVIHCIILSRNKCEGTFSKQQQTNQLIKQQLLFSYLRILLTGVVQSLF